MANEQMFFPVIAYLFIDHEVELAPNASPAVVIKKGVDRSSSHQQNFHNLWIGFPFGVFFIIPLVLLAWNRQWKCFYSFIY